MGTYLSAYVIGGFPAFFEQHLWELVVVGVVGSRLRVRSHSELRRIKVDVSGRVSLERGRGGQKAVRG